MGLKYKQKIQIRIQGLCLAKIQIQIHIQIQGLGVVRIQIQLYTTQHTNGENE